MAFTLSGDAATTRTNLGLGDAATKTTGTASGNIPVLDSSGQIADAQIAALSVSKLSGVGTTGQVLTSTGTTTAPTMQDAAAGGKVLQVVQSVTGATTQYNSNTNYVDIAGLSVAITPVKTGSKFLITANIALGGNQGRGAIRLVKDTTELTTGGDCWLLAGFSNSSQMAPASGTHLDSTGSTAGTSVTFKLTIRINTGGNWTFLNRDEGDTDHAGVSSITVTEIGA